MTFKMTHFAMSTITATALLTACGSDKDEAATPETQAQEIDIAETVTVETPEMTKMTTLTFPLMNTSQNRIGTIELEGNNQPGVKLTVSGNAFPEGGHGIHFHVKADCSAADFTSAGGINPDNKQHGLENADGPDNADMPNAVAKASGILNYSYTNDRVSLTGGNEQPALLDEDGSALVIHENPDDQKTQPIGGAGARIACAEISR